MSTEVVPLAIAVLLIACLSYPVIIGWLMLAGFGWGVLAILFPRLRI